MYSRQFKFNISVFTRLNFCRNYSDALNILGKDYIKDEWTNITPKMQSFLDRQLHKQKHHPLGMLSQLTAKYMQDRFRNRRGNALFSVHDSLPPIVTTTQNFDNILIEKNHPSRSKSDTYYINSTHLLRTHTSAHQHDLMKAGLDNFLVIGDVYRRDEVNATHYPVFHQIEGVRLCTKEVVFQKNSDDLEIFEKGEKTKHKQECHTVNATKQMEIEMKSTIEGLAYCLLDKELKVRWVDTYFPFTHPSWELEIFHKNKWLEILGCGIMEQKILDNAGVLAKMGWAFGIGLERLAMLKYDIPDIRLFWSTDEGFLRQFRFDDPATPIKLKPISKHPENVFSIAFWIPDGYSSNDFYDIVRDVGGDVVQHVELKDEFVHPKTKKQSHCYEICYRHMEKTLTNDDANIIHKEIERQAHKLLGVIVR